MRLCLRQLVHPACSDGRDLAPAGSRGDLFEGRAKNDGWVPGDDDLGADLREGPQTFGDHVVASRFGQHRADEGRRSHGVGGGVELVVDADTLEPGDAPFDRRDLSVDPLG